MNERDSESLSCLLEHQGFRPCEDENDADIIILNTCSVRKQTEAKEFGKIGLLIRLKRKRPELILGVAGCMSQNHGTAIIERFPHVDFVVGTDRFAEIPQIIERVRNGAENVVETERGTRDWDRLALHNYRGGSAYVTVMRGCNQFCSYCIVPHVRGREVSRPLDSILGEVRRATSAGIKEIILLGQNITAYGLNEARREGTLDHDDSPFAELLRAVDSVKGVRRIRFISPHVKYMNRELIDTMCRLETVCNAFHIPLQSGSDRILDKMRRGYTVAEYMNTIRQIRELAPGTSFSTDIIVGFPGESEQEFEATRETVRQVRYDMGYIFKYSPREGTHAADNLTDDVPPDVKLKRNKVLLDDLERITEEGNLGYVGRQIEVLVEGPSKRNSSRWQGRSEESKVCIFEPADSVKIGDLVNVTIERTTPRTLFGKL